MDDHEIVLSIQEMLDGVSWDSEMLGDIAKLLISNGYRIRDRHDRDIVEDYEEAAP